MLNPPPCPLHMLFIVQYYHPWVPTKSWVNGRFLMGSIGSITGVHGSIKCTRLRSSPRFNMQFSFRNIKNVLTCWFPMKITTNSFRYSFKNKQRNCVYCLISLQSRNDENPVISNCFDWIVRNGRFVVTRNCSNSSISPTVDPGNSNSSSLYMPHTQKK